MSTSNNEKFKITFQELTDVTLRTTLSFEKGTDNQSTAAFFSAVLNGPFIEISHEQVRHVIFLPHFYVRSIPGSTILEFIPICLPNSEIYTLRFTTPEVLSAWSAAILRVKRRILTTPFKMGVASVPVLIAEPNTIVKSDITILQSEITIEKKNERFMQTCSFPLRANTSMMIKSHFELNIINPDESLTILFNNSQKIDDLQCVVTDIFIAIYNLKSQVPSTRKTIFAKSTNRSQLTRILQEFEFPQPSYCVKPSEYICSDTMKFSDQTFSLPVPLPEKATTSWEPIQFEFPVTRRLFIQSSTSRPKRRVEELQVRVGLVPNDQLFKSQCKKIRECMYGYDPKIRFTNPVPHRDIINFDQDTISFFNSQLLTNNEDKPIPKTEQISPLWKMLKLIPTPSKITPFGEKTLNKLRQLLVGFNKTHDVNNSSFLRMCTIFVGALLDLFDENEAIPKFTDWMSKKSPKLAAFLPFPRAPPFAAMLAMIIRLISRRRISFFLHSLLTDLKWRTETYQPASLMRNPTFVEGLTDAMQREIPLSGIISFSELSKMKPEIIEPIDTRIKVIVDSLINEERGSFVTNLNPLYAALISNLVVLFEEGYTPPSGRALPQLRHCWYLFNQAANQITTEEADRMKEHVRKVSMMEITEPRLLLSNLFIAGLNDGELWVFALFAYSVALQEKCYRADSPVMKTDVVMNVINSLQRVSKPAQAVDAAEITPILKVYFL